ncbi:hypothetical protein [Paraburkholderia sacchari]|uniref:hypothetical protein n=1 Tax=Paraburkholderia sacchari TaxID=159450 RepID=UPI003D979B13
MLCNDRLSLMRPLMAEGHSSAAAGRIARERITERVLSAKAGVCHIDRTDVLDADAGDAGGSCVAEADGASAASSDDDDGGGDPDPDPNPDGPPAPCWTISASASEGLTVSTPSDFAFLAIIGPTGQILASGAEVAHAAWSASVLAYRDFLTGGGHLRSHARAPGVRGGR